VGAYADPVVCLFEKHAFLPRSADLPAARPHPRRVQEKRRLRGTAQAGRRSWFVNGRARSYNWHPGEETEIVTGGDNRLVVQGIAGRSIASVVIKRRDMRGRLLKFGDVAAQTGGHVAMIPWHRGPANLQQR